ncbi:hypothetical protein EDEG_00300 [Edhazardia aedis USNM 41457]|uniref:Uncharacterized protein n=1 Tax=Edhazardia aedis (strain USNM 41457) TaxID=1003232 RepID=J8ZRJ8_EDHAE|nr:hypothetical protein EDEG_00300 [Edhazardia aedis USNM 41457]|eukprot:EJW02323.1 hypothetical protein EDEG_00300 [Edhazardia aedis USNM 41457]
MEKEEMIVLLINTLFVISPVIGFIPQLWTRNIVFSPVLSLMLIFSSIFKFFYFRVENFSKTILYQAAVVLITQLALIYNYKHRLGNLETKIYNSRMLFLNKLHKKYGLFLLNLAVAISIYVGISTLASFVVNEIAVYDFCGYASMIMESFVGVMQLVIKRMDKNNAIDEFDEEKRLPKELFLSWIIGDIAKLYYMHAKETPLRLTLPIYFQIMVDFILIFQ